MVTTQDFVHILKESYNHLANSIMYFGSLRVYVSFPSTCSLRSVTKIE